MDKEDYDLLSDMHINHSSIFPITLKRMYRGGNTFFEELKKGTLFLRCLPPFFDFWQGVRKSRAVNSCQKSEWKP
jgi:hypothetical protein